ncbi:MAG: N-acetylglucosamine-6-phosphate deacetylase [Treponema sp.]|jgi:N-acetylglucosamine-6-phosphate deacetylase|nr:N-acetylglucosamine-6-phosphate deacetylase [Treponema sp.]
MDRVLFTNVRVVLPSRIVSGSVLVENGTIAAVSEDAAGRCFTGEGAARESFDGKGRYLVPGFIDIHNHGRLGVNVMDSAEALEKVARGQLAHGVTGFLAGTSTRPWDEVLASVRVIAEYCRGDRPDRSQCLGIYSEGTFFSHEKRGAHNPAWLSPPGETLIDDLCEAGGDALKVVALSPEIPGALDAVSRLRRRGLVVAAAHSNADYGEAAAGIDAGISLSTHTFNGMRGLHHQDPGILGAVLNDDRVFCELIADGIHISPPVLSMVYKLKGAGGTVLVSDSVELNGLPDGEYRGGDGQVTLRNGAIRLADGRLAGSCLSLDQAVRNMTVLAGVPLWEAAAMASLTPARVLGLDARKGSIEPGKDADMALLDETLAVQAVFIGGKACSLTC